MAHDVSQRDTTRAKNPDHVDRPRSQRLPSRLVAYRDVERHDVVVNLRGLLGLDPWTPAPGEQTAAFCVVPSTVVDLDAGAWIAWCMAGLPLFSGGPPSLAIAHEVTALVVLTRTMLQAGGNLSEAARLTSTCRKILRDNLRRLEIYEWSVELRRVMERGLLPDHHPLVIATIRGARVQGVEDV